MTDELLASCQRRLLEAQAVLGLACDGGWWVLGVQTPATAECLRSVPMSQPDTYRRAHVEGIARQRY